MKIKIEPDSYYMIEGSDLLRLATIAKRLYTENRMNGDEMRDAAQAIDYAVRISAQVPLK